jgi:hypothetical protein
MSPIKYCGHRAKAALYSEGTGFDAKVKEAGFRSWILVRFLCPSKIATRQAMALSFRILPNPTFKITNAT